ncbi:MAG: hypothetical protein M9894_14785 [Planctomycetes bacterium]|nr:hypothetical protein [Planctomycetota bacterium]
MALTFSCGCGASITVPDVLAGHEGRCPGCDGALRAPGVVRAPAPPPARATLPGGVRVVTAAPRGVLAPATRSRLILEFPCPGCAEVLRVATAHAGKPARCTLCAATFVVPEPPGAAPPSPPPAPPAPPTPAPRPGRDAFRVVRVACACGRQVAAPLARLEQGLARCPTCDQVLGWPAPPPFD